VETKLKENAAQLKPFDDSMWDRWSMYNNMPYVWDPDLNVELTYSKVSGNVIKSYRCQIKEPFELKHE
jgi:hypothetical protein